MCVQNHAGLHLLVVLSCLGLAADAASANKTLALPSAETASTHEPPPPRIGTVVTAFSRNHFKEAWGLIHSAQHFLPAGWDIVVYDLLGDMQEKDVRTVKSWCRVTYKRFTPPQDFVFEKKYLTNSAWKPLIIRSELRNVAHTGLLIWGDASTRFLTGLPQNLSDVVAAAGGYIGRETTGPLSNYTHPGTLKQLSQISEFVKEKEITKYMSAPVVCGCVGVYANTLKLWEKIVNPFVDCAKMPACIRPKGADGFHGHSRCHPGLEGHCHRGDQSVLSALLFNRFDAWGRPWNTTKGAAHADELPYIQENLLASFLVTKRNDHRSAEPQTCQDHTRSRVGPEQVPQAVSTTTPLPTVASPNGAAELTVAKRLQDRGQHGATSCAAFVHNSLGLAKVGVCAEVRHRCKKQPLCDQPRAKPHWIFLLGDSSVRMLNAALVEHVNGSLEDSRFGSYEVHDKGGCVQAEEGGKHGALGCMREFVGWDQHVRLTYLFKTEAATRLALTGHFVTPSAQPDTFVLATGAHDFYHHHSVNHTVRSTSAWITEMLARFPASRFVFLNLVACHESFRERALQFNAAVGRQWAGHPRVRLVDRGASTEHITDKTRCEGWHAYGCVVLQHLGKVLDHVCAAHGLDAQPLFTRFKERLLNRVNTTRRPGVCGMTECSHDSKNVH